ncbi:hypothetical protein BKA67DRAFT_688338 [Truncatella angustata]|uniref:Uncharacterized protein n=1 Tax=Truncatella angustata TaxID=152316 RepID=A0A9P8URU7_9PEZI|nr:uncharacterized protein BKA67DRAFT_688338 [Truncatella angustata]KAH6656962.1 hypothetical protein BKA67DRAFT_688338 [Truncatella angustata]KAH8194746.1 hypothetical protein TruAng_011088 [Truncatella angustata]
MANVDGNPPHTQGSFNPAPRQTRTSTARSSWSHGSYETGESSTTGGESSTARDSDLLSSTQPEYQATSRPRQTAKEDGRRRSHRPRPTGGFLLSDPVFDGKPSRPKATDRGDGRRRSRIPVDSRRAKSPMYATPDKASSVNTASPEHGTDTADMEEIQGDSLHMGKVRDPKASRIPSPRTNPPVDLDSTQIVSMALNLSESRRMAQRRNVSTPVPPRLTQVPDSPVGGSLKQHLQQQRRTSRNISPSAKPEKGGLAPRSVSVSHPRLTSPLQTSFEPDNNYTYHFSSSTLNRAQKAKEHFELMAQYRRLLNLVPPLQHKGQTSRPSTSSPPTSPTLGPASSFPFAAGQLSLGRPYNPLQYIRNRKVRARERKAIDGEAQGFADVNRVTDWVDQAATMVATTPILQPDSPSIPVFPGAHIADIQNASSLPMPVSKPKRPRLDWYVEPADLVADLYWVEQDDNRTLIEDRNYTRIFPFPKKVASGSRPMSQEIHEPNTASSMAAVKSRGDAEGSVASADQNLSDSNAVSRASTETSRIGTRDRARQKLHEIRGLHHRHEGSAYGHHDFLHLRKSSYSDTSDSEVDRRKRDRSGTISARDQALLEKQMNEMLAKEPVTARKPTPQVVDMEPQKPIKPTLMTPEKTPASSGFFNSGHNRKGSRIESSNNDHFNRTHVRHGSPTRPGRASLEVPGWKTRASMDLDSSAPSSPDLKASSSGVYIPAIGMDLSPPSSRAESPVRNTFSKVKSIFRDRSRDRSRERAVLQGRDDTLDSPVEEVEQPMPSRLSVEGIGSTFRQRSKSPAPKIPRTETQKSHKSMGSLRLGKDEQSGLRTILKGSAKIDGIIRRGVSNVSELLWKKDDGSSTDTSSDESEIEPARGRTRTSPVSHVDLGRPLGQPQDKHYLDIMPPFKPTSQVGPPAVSEDDSVAVPLNHSTSRRSPRVERERLKLPRIDVLNASPDSSPFGASRPREIYDESAISDTELQPHNQEIPSEAIRKSSTQLNSILALPVPASRQHRGSLGQNRHWSISDRSPSPHPQKSTQLSKREVARLRTLALSSGIKAMEIARRTTELQSLTSQPKFKSVLPISWDELAPFVGDGTQVPDAVSQIEVYVATSHILTTSIDSSDAALEKSASAFINGDMRQLRNRVDGLHARVATELIDMTRRAADEADECSRDMVDSQRLKVKRVVDIIDTMLRRRRRRFRWVRRGGWLMVEWALVGFMWYVWFVVTILRIFLGIGRGAWNGVRWLLWLR